MRALAAFLSAAVGVAATPPVIARLSGGGVGPNETLLIQGTGLSGGSARLCPVRGGLPCVTLPGAPTSWDGGLKVTLPADPQYAAAFSVAVCSPGGTPCSDEGQVQRYAINVPRVSWLLGDGALDGGVVAGGVLRAFGSALAWDVPGGRCVPASAPSNPIPPGALPPTWSPGLGALQVRPAPNSNTTAALCGPGGAPPCTLLTVWFSSCFRVDAVVPSSLAPGAYALVIDNGLASILDANGSAPAIRVDAPQVWPHTVFTVGGSCGGVGACLTAAAAAGGGRVVVPPGIWDVPANSGLLLGQGVSLEGTSASASVLRWAANTAEGAPAVGLGCSGNASVANVTLLFSSPIQVCS